MNLFVFKTDLYGKQTEQQRRSIQYNTKYKGAGGGGKKKKKKEKKEKGRTVAVSYEK